MYTVLLRLMHRFERGQGIRKDSFRAVMYLKRILAQCDDHFEGFGALATNYMAEYLSNHYEKTPNKHSKKLY